MQHATEWKQLFRTLTIGRPVGGEVHRPSTAEIDGWEEANGVTLPASYKSFIQLFGPGELGGFFTIHAPCQPRGSADLTAFQSLVRGTADIIAQAIGDKEFVRSMFHTNTSPPPVHANGITKTAKAMTKDSRSS